MPFMHATFAHAEDTDAIPLDGKVIQVVAPQVDKKCDGGIGLDELHVYLNPDSREGMLSDGSTSEPGTEWRPPDQTQDQVMDVKLERTCTSIFHSSLSQIQMVLVLVSIFLSSRGGLTASIWSQGPATYE